MASSITAVPPLSDLSGVAEEIRRQLASAKDAQLASEVSQHDETVLSNIMLTGQQSGQVAPVENLESKSSSVAKVTAVSPVSNSQIGSDRDTSTDAQTTEPTYTLRQVSDGSATASHHNLTPFDRLERQALTPDVHLAQSAQLEATPPSHAEVQQFSTERVVPQSASPDTNHAPIATAAIADLMTGLKPCHAMPPTLLDDPLRQTLTKVLNLIRESLPENVCPG